MINFIFLKNRLNFGNVQGAGGISNEPGKVKRKKLAQKFLEQSIEDENESKRLQRKNKRKLSPKEKDVEIGNQILGSVFNPKQKNNNQEIDEETTAGLQNMFGEMQDSLQKSLEKTNNQIEKTDELINKVNQISELNQNDQSKQPFRQDENVQNPEINQNENDKILDYDEELTRKLIKRGAFKEISNPEETRRKTRKIYDLNESLIKAELKDGKLNLKVSDNVKTDFNKVLNTKEGKNGFTVSDISGGKNSISVNKSKDGITNFELNVPEKNDKKPILNLPHGAKIELGDDDGKPKLFINDEKDLKKLQKKYNGKIKVDGIKFEDIDVVVGKDNELGIKAGFEEAKNQVGKSQKQEAGVTQPEQNLVNQVQVTQTEQNPSLIQDQTLSKEKNKKESNKNEIQGNNQELNKSSKRKLESDDFEEKKATKKKTKIQESIEENNKSENISKPESSSSAKNDKSENISKSEPPSSKKGEIKTGIINVKPIQTPEMAKSDNALKNIDQNIIKSVKEIGQDAFGDLFEAQQASILKDVEQREQENINNKTSLKI